mmetsp:Transcript_54027/g.89912  ORF Transcript_54027/g.89912 Transcript_54027/m.89912 type:complete len:314 (+) Transcript_54027:318-1259(+)
MTVVLTVSKEAVIKHLELAVLDHLSPVLGVLDGGASRLVSSHDGHSGIVESTLVGSADEFDHVVATDLAVGTKVDKDSVEELGCREELLVAQEHPDVDDVKVGEGLEEVVGDVACCDDGSQADVPVQVVCHCLVLGEQGKRNRRSLRVSNVEQLGVGGRLRDVLPHRWQVILGHLVPGELPEFLLVRVEGDVALGVEVAAVVAHPDIVAAVPEEVREGLVGFVENPGERGVEETVLEQDGKASGVGHAEDGEDVAIFGRDVVGFDGVSFGLDDLRKVAVGVWVDWVQGVSAHKGRKGHHTEGNKEHARHSLAF